MITPLFSSAMNLPARDFEPLRMFGEAAFLLLGLDCHDEARKVIDALLAIAPHRALPHIVEAHLLAAQRQYRRAEESARQAMRLASDSPAELAMACTILGIACSKLGRGAQAEQVWRTALAADPDGPGGREAQAALQLETTPPVQRRLQNEDETLEL